MNENIVLKLYRVFSLLAGRCLPRMLLSLRKDDCQNKQSYSLLSYTTQLCAVLILACTAGFSAIPSTSTIALNQELANLEGKVSVLSTQTSHVSQLVFVLAEKIRTTPFALNVGDVFAKSGDFVNIPIFFYPGPTPTASLQLDLKLPVGVSSNTVTTGTAATDAQKGVSSAAVSGGIRIIVSGLNQMAIGQGIVAIARLKIGSNVPKGFNAIKIQGQAGANPAGGAVPLVGYHGSVTVN